MGASLRSRSLLAIACLFLGLLGWEATLAWCRYEPVDGRLGGFMPTDLGIQPREPGETRPGPLVPAEVLVGARYDLLRPRLLSPLLGTSPRIRLVGLELLDPQTEGATLVAPWGGGRDPLATFLWITSPLTGWWIQVERLDLKAPRTDVPLALAPAPDRDELILVPGSP